MDAFFNFSLFVLLMKTKQTFLNKTALSIPVNLNTSKRKEGKSHLLKLNPSTTEPFGFFMWMHGLANSTYVEFCGAHLLSMHGVIFLFKLVYRGIKQRIEKNRILIRDADRK